MPAKVLDMPAKGIIMPAKVLDMPAKGIMPVKLLCPLSHMLYDITLNHAPLIFDWCLKGHVTHPLHKC